MMIPKKASNKALKRWRTEDGEVSIEEVAGLPLCSLRSSSRRTLNTTDGQIQEIPIDDEVPGALGVHHQAPAAGAAASASSLGAAAPAQYCIVTPDTQIFCDDEAEVLQVV